MVQSLFQYHIKSRTSIKCSWLLFFLMAPFQHALQVCTIACVCIAIDGHLMLAVNVEDFRNLANKFLSKDLADKLTHLVSHISLGRKSENTQKVEAKLPVIKENPIKESARTNQYPTETIGEVTDNFKHKRFNTVKNSDNKEFLRQVIYNTPPGLVYERDEIDDLLQNINEGHSDDDDNYIRKVHHPTRIVEKDYTIHLEEATRPLNLINMSRDTLNKIDYTETKLGEWKYNHDVSKEPPEIKNIKIGNADRDINDEGSTDYDKVKMHESTENDRHVQYVDESRLLGRHKNVVKDHQVDKEEHIVYTKPKDNSIRNPYKEPIDYIRTPNKQLLESQTKIRTTKDDSPILGKKNKINHEHIPKQDEASISQNIKEIEDPKQSRMLLNDFLNDSQEVKQPRSEDKKTKQKELPMPPIENNNMYEKYALGSEIKINNKKGVNHQSVEDSKEKPKRETKKIQNGYDNKKLGDQSGNDEQLLLRNKKRYLSFKVPENSEEYSKKVPPKQVVTHRPPHHDEEKSVTDKSKSGHSREAKKIQYEDNGNEGDQSGNKEQLLLIRNKKRYLNFEDPENSKEYTEKLPLNQISTHRLSNRDEDKPVADKSNVPLINSKKHYATSSEETNEASKEVKEYIGKKKPHYDKDKFDTDKSKAEVSMVNSKKVKQPEDKRYVTSGEESTEGNEDIEKKKPHKISKEENYMNQKFESGSENKKINKRKPKLHAEVSDYSKNPINEHIHHNNKSSYKAPSLLRKKQQFKDSEYCKMNPHSTICREKEVTKKIALKESAEVSWPHSVKGKRESFSDHVISFKIKDQQAIKSDNYDLINGSKQKNIHHRPQKKIEENNIYDKYELGLKTNNHDDSNVRKQKEVRDDKNNHYQGRKKDKSVNNEDMPINKKRKPEKKMEENDKFDKYELGHDENNRNRKQKDNRDGIKTMDDKNKMNYQSRDKEMPKKSKRKPQKKIDENDMYDKYELGRETKNDDNINRKRKVRDDIKTMDNNNKFNDHGRITDESANDEEITIKSKKRYKNIEDTTTTKYKQTKKGQGKFERVPMAGYADDPQPNYKEVKPESIKAKTESLLDSGEPKGKGRSTKKFTMKGTIVPKREFYKLSSPNYYKDLPRVVEKYDFEEPIPEQDRVRDKVEYLKREPSRVNKKVKLPTYEKIDR